jgi:hypothetical protein
MMQNDHHFYNQLTSTLGPEEQQIIKAALAQADNLAAQQAQAGADGSGAAVAPPHANGAAS